MNSSKKGGLVIILILSMSVFGYSQYASASQIGVSITDSKLLNENERGSEYNIELKFENPSLLMLTSGETEFFVIADERLVGKGQLEAFTLHPLNSSFVNAIYHENLENEKSKSVKITGVTKYDLIIASIEIPFVYYPTEEQAREFIHQD